MAGASVSRKRLGIEPLEDRTMMSVGPGIVERPGYPIPIDVKLEGTNLVVIGKDNLDDNVQWRYVKPEQIGFKKADGTPLLDRNVPQSLEIGHTGSTATPSPLKYCWVDARKVTDWIVFSGGGGKDTFEYKPPSQQTDPWDTWKVKVFASGGRGDDKLHGYKGHDLLFGDDGVDYLRGHWGCDLLNGGRDNDTLVGDGPARTLPKGSRDDADYLVGGPGLDKLYGDQGNDLLNGGNYSEIIDGVLDELYGYGEADRYFIESDREAKGFSANQGDTKHREGETVKPPDYTDWMLKRHPSFDLNKEAVFSSTDLPNLRRENFWVLSPSDPNYNCHSAAMGVYDRTFPTDQSVTPPKSWFDVMYRKYGYNPHANGNLGPEAGLEKVVVFTKGVEITHSARQLADGTWVSKLGSGALIRHKTLNDVAGGIYGTPTHVYSRPRTTMG